MTFSEERNIVIVVLFPKLHLVGFCSAGGDDRGIAMGDSYDDTGDDFGDDARGGSQSRS